MASSWRKCTYGFPLEPELFTLRSAKSNIDLAREFVDCPAIYNECLTQRGRVPGRFSYGKIIKVVMLLDAMEYETVESHVHEAKALVRVF